MRATNAVGPGTYSAFGATVLVSASTNRMLDGDFTPDGGMFVTVGGVYAQFGEIKIWGTGMARHLGDFHGHKRWLEAVAVTKDGRLITGGGINQPIQRGGGTRAIPLGVTEATSQEMEPGELRAWDLAGLYPQLELKGHSNAVTCGHGPTARFNRWPVQRTMSASLDSSQIHSRNSVHEPAW